LKPKDYEKILDVGTGTGRIARKIVGFRADVIGIDVDYARIKHATIRKKNLGDYAHRYKLVVADGQFLPFRNSSFDAIVCIRNLKYLSNYQLGIKEMSRVLKPDGRLILSLSNIFSLDPLLLKIGIDLSYKTLFTFRSVKNIFLRNNLGIINYLGLHKIHPQVWTWFKSPHILALLKAAELILQKVTPKEFLSREILVKFMKKTSHAW